MILITLKKFHIIFKIKHLNNNNNNKMRKNFNLTKVAVIIMIFKT